MELVDRYLYAVGNQLQGPQAADIVAELGDSIRSQMEEEEGRLGRPLSEEEQSAIIKSYGPPVLCAARYQPPRALIGPLLLPYYWRVMRLFLTVIFIIEIAAVSVSALTGEALDIGAIWGLFWGTLVGSVGLITIVFAVMQYFQDRSSFISRWDPRNLPKRAGTQPIPRAQSVFELVLNVIWLAWLIDIPGVRNFFTVLFSGGGARAGHVGSFAVTGWWHIYLGGLLALCLANIIVAAIALAWPDSSRLRAGAMLAESVIMLIVSAVCIGMRPFVVATAAVQHKAEYIAAASALDHVVYWALLVSVAVAIVAGGVNIWLLVRRTAAWQPIATPAPGK